jgi:DNA-binding GntR family transcriptional regulator
MEDAGTAVEASGTGGGPMEEELRVERIAAELAAEIDAGRLHRWEELPSLAVLADEYDVAERTITSVKRLLAVHDFLTLEKRRYYVA